MKIKYWCILFLICSPFVFAFGQTRIIKGNITSTADKQPLTGVTVLIKNTFTGTISDFDGNYSIEVNDNPATRLVFSFIGMESQEVEIGNRSEINVVLRAQPNQLSEAIVIGYGSVKTKESMVGSVAQVKAEDLRMETTTESFDKLLEGAVAGVHVEKSSGDIGAKVEIRVRGQGSLTKVFDSDIVASSEPLYILDGVPLYDIYEPNTANNVFENKVSPLSLINPEDIESVTILKDATAAAIYGANASNGVVLITTKSGKQGDNRISISHTSGISNAINMVEYLNAEQYVEVARETYLNSGKTLEQANELAGSSEFYTNWPRLLLRTAYSHQTNISLSGGEGKTTYRVSGAYSNFQTITMGNDASRFTTRVNMQTAINSKLKADYVLGFSYMHKNIVPFEGYPFLPNQPAYNDDGTINNHLTGASKNIELISYTNPLANLYQNEEWNKSYYTNGSLKLSYKVNQWLEFASTIGVDLFSMHSFRFASKENGAGRTRGGYINDKRSNNIKSINYNQLNINKTFGKHRTGGVIGFQIEDRESSGLQGMEQNLPLEKIKVPGLASKENTSLKGSSISEGGISYYSRLDYGFDNRYNLSFNLRQDVSSMFGGDFSRENFASAGASWLINKEKFLENANYFDILKLRASFGKTGNARIGSYASMGLFSYNSSISYNGLLGAVATSGPNNMLGWEKRYKSNLAVDIGIYKKYSLTVEYYYDYIKDAITSYNTAIETGFNSISMNAADFVNRGVEATLLIKDIGNKLKWNTNFNISTNFNKITRLANNINKLTESTYISRGLVVGQDISILYGSVYKGVDPLNGDALWELPSGEITNNAKLAHSLENRRVIGKTNPDFYGGWMNSFKFENFDLGIKLTFEYGADFLIPYNYVYSMTATQIDIRNQTTDVLNRWQKPGDITNMPRLTTSNYFSKASTRYMYDKSNIAFNSFSLGYNLHPDIARKLGVRSCRVYLEGVNLFRLYMQKTGKNVNGVKEYRYPFPEARSFSAGINLNF